MGQAIVSVFLGVFAFLAEAVRRYADYVFQFRQQVHKFTYCFAISKSKVADVNYMICREM